MIALTADSSTSMSSSRETTVASCAGVGAQAPSSSATPSSATPIRTLMHQLSQIPRVCLADLYDLAMSGEISAQTFVRLALGGALAVALLGCDARGSFHSSSHARRGASPLRLPACR